MYKSMYCAVFFSILLCITGSPGYSATRATQKILPASSESVCTSSRSTENLQNYKAVTSKIQAPANLRTQYDASFNKLPAAAQFELIKTIDRLKITKVTMPEVVQLPPHITYVSTEVSPGNYGFMCGTYFNSSCRVYGDLSTDLLLETQFVWNILVFKVPSNRPLGTFAVYVKDPGSNKVSNTVNTVITAPRGYRGQHGFSFSNFGTPTISWDIFKSYFGTSEVEFANGTKRPAAEAWYNSSYKGVGGGGDCYGMSMRSIRVRRGDWRGNHNAWWPANRKPRVWDYSKTNEVADSVRWDQGGQLSIQSAAVIADRYANQNHQEAFNLIKNRIATNDSNQQPIICMWGPRGGHAVVGYKTSVSGIDQKIYFWDNNRPYRTNVADDESSTGIVKLNNQTFSYSDFTKMIAFPFNAVNPADPNLPATAAGEINGLSANTTIITCDGKGAIKQIRDEKGRTLLGPNGTINTNKATMIPDAAVITPMAAGLAKLRNTKQRTTVQRTTNHQIGDQLPMYVFNNSTGKNLTVEFDSANDVAIRSFSRGTVNEINARKGSFALTNILKPNHTLDIIDPTFMNPRSLKVIRAEKDRSEKVFDITPKGKLSTKPLKLGMNTAGDGLLINNLDKTAINLSVASRKFGANGALQNLPAREMTIPGGKSQLFNLK